MSRQLLFICVIALLTRTIFGELAYSSVTVVVGLHYDVVSADFSTLTSGFAKTFGISSSIVGGYARKGVWTSVGLKLSGELSLDDVERVVSEYHDCVSAAAEQLSPEDLEDVGYDCTHIAPFPIDYSSGPHFHLAQIDVGGGVQSPSRRLFAEEDAPASERSGLELLYEYYGGSGWTVQTNWLDDDTPVCSWFGVTCAVVPFDDGGDNETHVVEVRLPANGLTLPGAVSSSNRRHLMSHFRSHAEFAKTHPVLDTIRGLTPGRSSKERRSRSDFTFGRTNRQSHRREFESRLRLRRLYADDEPIVPTDAIAALPFVRVFDVSVNDLTGGTIPDAIGDWSKLESIGLFYSGLTGTLPSTLANVPLRHFVYGHSEGYCYDGLLPMEVPCETPFEYMTAERLWAFLTFESLGYGGTLSDSLDIFGEIPTMEVLWYSTIPGEGEILPESFCDLTNLRSIEVLDSGFTGTLRECISDLPSLVTLSLSSLADLGGTIPESYGYMPSVVNFEFAATNLEGELPSSLQNLTSVFQFHVSENRFSGTIPEGVCTLPAAASFFLYSNTFDGDLPSSCQYVGWYIGGPVFFIINDNRLSGTLESWDFSSWYNTAIVYVQTNFFEGGLPSFANTNVSLIALSQNLFSGPIHENVLSPVCEEALLENSFGLEGEFPNFFDRYPYLHTFSLSGAQITGSIHESICSLQSLTFLTLTNLPLSGTLPDCFEGMEYLSSMRIRSTNVTGELPSSLGTVHSLRYLTIQDSDLTATWVPSSFVAHPNLFELNLSQNRLSGDINLYLYSLNVCPQLFTIDLSENSIFGILSPVHFVRADGTDRMGSLYNFIVNGNLISGELPFLIADLPNIASVRISNNLMEGEIPSGFGELSIFTADGNHFGCDESAPGYISDACTEMLPLSMVLTGRYVDTNLGVSCPELTSIISSNSLIQIDPLYYNYTLCRCDSGYFGTHGVCDTCISGGYCPGGDIDTALDESGNIVSLPILSPLPGTLVVPSYMYPDRGYYPSPTAEDPRVMIRCPQESLTEERCNPDLGDFDCLGGYKDRLCGACEKGYYRQGSSCSKCPESDAVAVMMFVVFLLLVAVFFALVIQHKRLMRLDDAMKAFLFFVQTIVLIYEKTGFIWPESIQRLNNLLKYGSVSISSFSCLTDGEPPSAYDSYLMSVTQPAMLFALVLLYSVAGLIYLTIAKKDKSEIEIHAIKSVHAFLFGLNVVYLPVTITVMEVFICKKDEGDDKYYMQFRPEVECDTDGDWGKMLTGSIIMMLFHVLLVPFGFAYLLYRCRDRLFSDEKVIGLLRFLYSPYKRKYYWYELATFARRMVLGIFATMLGSDSPITPFLLSVVIVTSAVVHSYLRPFNTFVLNTLESLVHLALGFTFICGNIFTSYANTDDKEDEKTALEVVVLILTIGVIALFLLLAVRLILFPKTKLFLTWSEHSLYPDEAFDGAETEGVGAEVGVASPAGHLPKLSAALGSPSRTLPHEPSAAQSTALAVGPEGDVYSDAGTPTHPEAVAVSVAV